MRLVLVGLCELVISFLNFLVLIFAKKIALFDDDNDNKYSMDD